MIYESPLWFEDIDAVSQNLSELSRLAGKSVLITGTTGLICSAVTDIFIRYNETHPVPIHIIAAGRWREKMTNRFGEFCDKPYFDYVEYDASKNNNQVDASADYIIHGASNADPKAIMKEPVETMLSNFTGLLYLLQYAKDNGIKRLLYISSSEVYGRKGDNNPYHENEYGYIDLLNPRNSYSVGKRAAEALCASYACEYGVESVIVRPGHIYGPTASPFDSRVSSVWAYAAARGEDIVMKSDGAQLRSYCHCLDCATAIIKVLMKGKSVHAYNISNPDSVVTVRQMAEALAKAGNVGLVTGTASEDEKRSFNQMNNSSLESSPIQKLGWKSLFDINYGTICTVKTIRETMG